MKKVLQSFALPLLLFATTANAQIFADAVISSVLVKMFLQDALMALLILEMLLIRIIATMPSFVQI